MIKSKRKEYFACHLTLHQRESLKDEAKRRKMSMSALAALFIATGLASAGCTTVGINEEEPFLPLEVE